MLTPVVLGTSQYARTTHPQLGDEVTWELGWTPHNSLTWSEFEPAWSMTAQVQARDKPMTTRLRASQAEHKVEQPCTGSADGVTFLFSSPLPVPETVTVTGALAVSVGTPLPNRPMQGPWHEVDPATLTTGVMARLRVVSMAWAMRPTRYAGWQAQGPVPGTEWVYDLAEPPEELHWFELAENDFGFRRRDEVLLVDLQT